MLTDTHCHLFYKELKNDLDAIISRAIDMKVTRFICVGTNIEDSKECLSISENNDNIFASVGVHPDYEDINEPSVDQLVSLSKNTNVVAIGETGLDYFRLKGDLSWQRERFRVHIRSAIKSGLPLIIHTRSAQDDTISIMKEEGADIAGGVMHCFTESYDMAKKAIDQNFYISFSGIITFKNAQDLRETVKKVPMNRILIETDSPYLAPVPNRGKTNEPSNVLFVAEKIAEIKNLSIEEVAATTTENFKKLFTKCHLS